MRAHPWRALETDAARISLQLARLTGVPGGDQGPADHPGLPEALQAWASGGAVTFGEGGGGVAEHWQTVQLLEGTGGPHVNYSVSSILS